MFRTLDSTQTHNISDPSASALITMAPSRDERIRQALLRCRDEGIGTDFIIQVGNMDIPCHRFILASVSRYFRAVFCSPMSAESILGCARFDQLKPDATLNVIRSIYGACTLASLFAAENEVLGTHFHVLVELGIKPHTIRSW